MSDSEIHEGDRTLTITDRPGGSSPTDKSYDLAGSAMKARLAKRMFGVDGEPPPMIGRFNLVRRVGAGGMGVVYEGHDDELNRRVAIKLLHPELDERHRVRMRREAQALAKLSHPNVVHAYEIGEHDGSLFLIMEFIEGEPLSTWQREHKGDWPAILAKYKEAGRGLAAAHDAGIVHRDFKPSNCVVCNDGPVRVLDFGLARSSTARPVTDEDRLPDDVPVLETRVTITGTTMGTPAYMSPEQMLGQPTTAASDQYSFCIALYEGVYGVRPFSGERAAELYEALQHELVNDAPPGSRVPAWLRAILLRGLKAKQEERFESMSELLAALEGPRKRSRWQPALAVVAVGGTAAAWAVAERGNACADGADGAAEVWNAEQKAAVAEAFAGSGAADHARATQGVHERLDEYVSNWSAQYKEACSLDDPGAARRTIACVEEAREALGTLVALLTEKDRGVVEHSFELVDELPALGDCRPGRPPAEDSAAERAALMGARLDALAGRTAAARARATEVLDAARASGSNAVVAQALLTLAMVAREETQWPEALGYAKEAATAALAAEERLLAADAWLEAAELEAHEGQLVASRDHLANARAFLEAQGYPGDRWARVRTVEGYQELQAGEPARGEPLLLEAVQALQAAHGEEHYSIARVLVRVGDTQRQQGKNDAALASYDRGRMMLAARAGSEYPGLWAFDYSIALLELGMGNPKNAIDRLQAALRLTEGRGGQFARPRATIQVALASAFMRSGDDDEALAAAQTARAELSGRVPVTNESRRNASIYVALLALRRGELEEAAEAMREVATAHEAADDLGNAAVAWAQLALVQLRRGLFVEANSVIERHRDVIAASLPELVGPLEQGVKALEQLASNDVAGARAGFEKVRAQVASEQDEQGWCETWAWATLKLAELEPGDRKRALAREAAAHLEDGHDPVLRSQAEALL